MAEQNPPATNEATEVKEEESEKVEKSETTEQTASKSGGDSNAGATSGAEDKNGEVEKKETDASNNGEAEAESEELELTKEELDTVLQSECIFGDVAFYNQVGCFGFACLEQVRDVNEILCIYADNGDDEWKPDGETWRNKGKPWERGSYLEVCTFREGHSVAV